MPGTIRSVSAGVRHGTDQKPLKTSRGGEPFGFTKQIEINAETGNPGNIEPTRMRRLYPIVAWAWGLVFAVAVVGPAGSLVYDKWWKADMLSTIFQFTRSNWLPVVLGLALLGVLSLWSYLDDKRHKAQDGAKRERVVTGPMPVIEVSPTISPAISTTISPTVSPTISPIFNISVPAPPVPSDSKQRVPHQLRPPPPDFTGRKEDITQLIDGVSRGERILAVHGMGGIGKTTLALKIAEMLTRDFPDGQIYLDLKGVPHREDTPGIKPLTAGEAIDHVIRSYNPGASASPNDDAREGEYRSTLFGKKVLLLMDNARNRDQVERLFPPAGCVMIVTSRDHFTLPGLKEKDLQKLPPQDARDLMVTIAERVRPLADEFAQLCDYLPEALRATASAIAERPNIDPREFIRRMRDAKERLKVTGVDLSLTTSSDLLDSELRNRWLLLSVFPDTFDHLAAAAVWDSAPDATVNALAELMRYNLVQWNPTTSRYRLHDLVRDFTTLRLDETARTAAKVRHAEHYKNVLAAADRKYCSGAPYLEGLALFDLEWSNIEAGQAWAATHREHDRSVSRLCKAYSEAGANVLLLRLPPRKRIKWLEAALDAARELTDRSSEGAALGNLGIAYRRLGEYHRAIEFHEKHLAISREFHDRLGEVGALGNLGVVYQSLGEYRRALEFHEQDLAIAREIGDRRGEGRSLGNLGSAYYSLGESRRAIECYEQQLAIARERGDRHDEGQALGGLGVAHCGLSEYRTAIEYLEKHLAIAQEIGDRPGEGDALFNSALALENLGEHTEAIRHAELALTIYEQIESPRAENLRARLATWQKLARPA